MNPDSSGEADHEAMQRLAEGEDLALNEIMQRWQQPVANYLYRQLGQQQTALDLAQETFVRVYQQRLRYKPSGKFSTWLFQIATNLGRNHVRWKKRHPEISLEDGDLPPELSFRDEAPDASLQLQSRERREELWRAISALPEELREALLLFEFEDFSHGEIAGILGCSPKAVETRLYRARAALRKALALRLEQE